MSKQYVYIFKNSSNPEIIKIGKTDKHPEIRAEQLNRQTGVIGKYEVLWSKEVKNNDIAEKILHFCFEDYRVEKEYFKINITLAIEISETVLKNFFAVISANRGKLKIDKLKKTHL